MLSGRQLRVCTLPTSWDSTKLLFSSALRPSTADGNFVGNYELATSHNGTAKVKAIHSRGPLYRHKSFGQQRHPSNVGRRGHAIALSKAHWESATALDEFLCVGNSKWFQAKGDTVFLTAPFVNRRMRKWLFLKIICLLFGHITWH